MNGFFKPQLLGPMPELQQPAVTQMPDFGPPPESVAPPAPQIVPVPVLVQAPPKRKGMFISPEAARKAQLAYPQEAAQKSAMMDRASAPPAPTGAWGAPE